MLNSLLNTNSLVFDDRRDRGVRALFLGAVVNLVVLEMSISCVQFGINKRYAPFDARGFVFLAHRLFQQREQSESTATALSVYFVPRRYK